MAFSLPHMACHSHVLTRLQVHLASASHSSPSSGQRCDTGISLVPPQDKGVTLWILSFFSLQGSECDTVISPFSLQGRKCDTVISPFSLQGHKCDTEVTGPEGQGSLHFAGGGKLLNQLLQTAQHTTDISARQDYDEEHPGGPHPYPVMP